MTFLEGIHDFFAPCNKEQNQYWRALIAMAFSKRIELLVRPFNFEGDQT